GSSSVSSDDYQRLEPGRNVTVQALSWAPSILPTVREASGSRNKNLIFFWGFSIIWNGMLSVFVWAIFVWPSIVRRLVVDGIPTPARVTRKAENSSDDSKSYDIHYEFIPEQAGEAPMQGKTAVTQEQWSSVSEGDMLTVLYNAKRPNWSVLYRFADYRVI
ncbi:MAG: hypothetical protein JWQ02_551, partial [Capsulimonas sp.]|nr:hypothetical protein [Capsulimonas sp.]